MEPTDAIPDGRDRRRLSPAWLAVGAIAILVLGLLGYSLAQKPALPPQKGNPVPTFQLTAFDGTSMGVGEGQGSVAVVNFFASWCDPCRQEAADVEQAWRDYRSRGVQFYGIGYKDAASKAKAFLDEFSVSYPATVEPGNRTARAYGVTGVPETFVIDRSGRLVRHFIGPVSRDELAEELDPLLEP
jgi:cytochrome c biogenesis protein CcmG/thiol:disulfide interchange protein DsbE